MSTDNSGFTDMMRDVFGGEDKNEERADKARDYIINEYEQDGPYTGISDAIANLLHLADRYGIDHDSLIDHARHAYDGDHEDGPKTKQRGKPDAETFDFTIDASNEPKEGN